MKNDIVVIMAKCPNCKQVKAEHRKLRGLLQYIDLPTWKWEEVNLDIVGGLPHTRTRHDSIWFIVERMTKSTYFLLVKITFSEEVLNYTPRK